jgi:hypothetical protein
MGFRSDYLNIETPLPDAEFAEAQLYRHAHVRIIKCGRVDSPAGAAGHLRREHPFQRPLRAVKQVRKILVQYKLTEGAE